MSNVPDPNGEALAQRILADLVAARIARTAALAEWEKAVEMARVAVFDAAAAYEGDLAAALPFITQIYWNAPEVRERDLATAFAYKRNMTHKMVGGGEPVPCCDCGRIIDTYQRSRTSALRDHRPGWRRCDECWEPVHRKHEADRQRWREIHRSLINRRRAAIRAGEYHFDDEGWAVFNEAELNKWGPYR